MQVAIMQPTYMPWLGYFDLIDQVDMFVLLDDVQFSKGSWQHRNRIKTPKGLEWLSVPLLLRGRSSQLIQDVVIRDCRFWVSHQRTLQANYGRSRYWSEYAPSLAAFFQGEVSWRSLCELNCRLIQWFCQSIGIDTPLVRSSSLSIDGKRTAKLVALCQALGAGRYLSPIGSANYLLGEEGLFLGKGITLTFHNYEHPVYTQLFGPFIPFASSIDLILNEGERALAIIRSGRGQPYTPDRLRIMNATQSGAS